MTKKDYELIASAFKKDVDFLNETIEKQVKNRTFKDALSNVRTMANTMATVLEVDNPKFDRDRFLKACGVTE